jgi:long-chain acyl-CoA synthetase
VLYGVPTIYSAINAYGDIGDYDISSLRFCISGGAALPVDIKQTFEGLTGCTLVEGYGLTETGPVCTINPIVGLNKPGSAGLPIPGTVIEIASLDDPDRMLPLGDRGEICVTGPQVMAGYAKQEAETEAVLRGGRLHTGDVGYMDEQGYLYIIDRIKDLIITGGFNVYPRMVEEAIHLHPDVAEVAVCGVPSKHRGEIIKAYVIVREGAELGAAELKKFLKDKLAPFEQPRQIQMVEEIPKTLIGKPLRRELVAAEIRRLKEDGDDTAEDDEGEGNGAGPAEAAGAGPAEESSKDHQQDGGYAA